METPPETTAATPTESGGGPTSDSGRTLWGDVRYELVRNPVFWFSAVLVVVIMVMAFFPQLFAPTSPNSSGACQLQLFPRLQPRR